MSEVIRYKTDNCRKAGSQEHLQLTKEESLGKASLVKRVSNGEIHISPSDKGKGLVVMSVDMYHRMCIVHTEADKKVEWRELEECQKEVRSHARALARMVKLGESAGGRNRGRCFDNISSWACDPPVLRYLAKIHKPLELEIIPKSRPIVRDPKSLTTDLGELVLDILEPMTRAVDDQREAKSTE